MSSDLPGVNPATLNGILLYYRLMTRWSGLGDSTELSRVGLSHQHGVRLQQGTPISTQWFWRTTYLYSSRAVTCSSEGVVLLSLDFIVKLLLQGLGAKHCVMVPLLKIGLMARSFNDIPHKATQSLSTQYFATQRYSGYLQRTLIHCSVWRHDSML
jgi:hypothetical protein